MSIDHVEHLRLLRAQRKVLDSIGLLVIAVDVQVNNINGRAIDKDDVRDPEALRMWVKSGVQDALRKYPGDNWNATVARDIASLLHTKMVELWDQRIVTAQQDAIAEAARLTKEAAL